MKMMYKPSPVPVEEIQLPEELNQLVEVMAKNVHEVWAAARMTEGWTYGVQRSEEARTHPGLVPYEKLSESEKEYDRRTAVTTLKLIRKMGFEIKREVTLGKNSSGEF